MYSPGLSRRIFLKLTSAGGASALAGAVTFEAAEIATGSAAAEPSIAPKNDEDQGTRLRGKAVGNCLTAQLGWDSPAIRSRTVQNGMTTESWSYFDGINLKVSTTEDMKSPIVDIRLAENITSWRIAVLPARRYYWQIVPYRGDTVQPSLAFNSTFSTAKPFIDEEASIDIRYKNPRAGAHYADQRPIAFAEYETLSPWYEIKSYNSPPPPKFADIRDKLPFPILDGRPDALEAYWYCWKTLIEIWYWAPAAHDHQAVANLNGCPSWGWGSSQVWDSAIMMYFARYGHQAYSFIDQYDNAYARQHENGFICREADANNQEVYSRHPALCPFLMGWAEWKYYLVSGDLQRLKRILLPIVKNYEWWMIYMRRQDGLYWKQGLTEAERLNGGGDDSLDYAVGNNGTRAAEALHIAKIASAVGRHDLADFFAAEHKTISKMVNDHFWDAEHGIYNDRADPKHPILKYNDPKLAGRFITETSPGSIDKPFEIFMPLFGEIVPPDRLSSVVKELANPRSFNRPNGIPKISADSKDPDNSVWPPPQCLILDGLKAHDQAALAGALADRYFNAVVAAYGKDRTITEGISADRIDSFGHTEFVGWGGVGPVAYLIEYVLGFDLNVPENTITWRITRTDRHGIRNLKFGPFYVEFLCAPRADDTHLCTITLISGGTFNLNLIVNGKTSRQEIHFGKQVIRV